MPTLLTHPIVPLSIAIVRRDKQSLPLTIVGCLASVLPDADAIGFHFGVPYGHLFGHRGFSHSIVFALLVGVFLSLWAKKLHSSKIFVFLFVFLCTLSHGILDAMTTGGLGIAFFSPFTNGRYFLPWRPIVVSPLAIHRFLGGKGVVVLLSELEWVWGPCLAIAGLAVFLKRAMKETRVARGPDSELGGE